MTIDQKARYIKDNSIVNLSDKDWWANDPDKNYVWNSIQQIKMDEPDEEVELQRITP